MFKKQYVVRPSLDYRGFSSQVASGIISKGDEVMVLPSRKKSFVKEIVTYDGNLDYAFPPQSVTITLNDEIDISRGDMLVHPNNLPKVERHFEAMLVWMDESPMKNGTQFLIKHTSQTTKARIDKIQHLVDVNTLEKRNSDKFELNEIGRVVITTTKPLFFDAYKKNRQTGSFIFIDPVTHNTCAVGMIIDKLSSDDLPSRIIGVDKEKITTGVGLIAKSEYESVYQQKGATIWLTGLHGSGKNELAYTLQKSLFDMGAKVMLLDGKSVRAGLSKELDYTPTDRAEHMRRVAHICKLMNDQGILVVCSFVSPDESVRKQVAEIIGEDKFSLVYLDSDIDFCRDNDKYGLYEKADEGALKYLPGVDMEYQVPSKPSLKIDAINRAKNLELLINYLNKNKIFPI